MKRIGTEKLEEILPECIEIRNTLVEKEGEIQEIEQSGEEAPAWFDSIEHCYNFMDREEFRQMQLEHLRERVHELRFTLYTHSKRLQNEGMPNEVWIAYDGYMVFLPFIESEGDYIKIQAFTE